VCGVCRRKSFRSRRSFISSPLWCLKLTLRRHKVYNDCLLLWRGRRGRRCRRGARSARALRFDTPLTFLPAYLTTHLPNYLPSYLPSYPPSYLLTYTHTCIPNYAPAFLPTKLPGTLCDMAEILARVGAGGFERDARGARRDGRGGRGAT